MMIKEQQFTAKVQQVTASDPRIDSPDVQVIYPSPVEGLAKETIKQSKTSWVETEPMAESQEQPVEKKEEEHQCKVDIQEAVKQNLLGFIVLVVLSLGMGYLIGKK